MPLNQEDPIKELYVIGFTRSYGRTDWSEDLNIESSVDPKTNEEYDNRRIILHTIREIFNQPPVQAKRVTVGLYSMPQHSDVYI
jgi:hypothetical protein